MNEFQVLDDQGFTWTLAAPVKFEKKIMWVFVKKGPDSLFRFQQIPLPVFTDWWPE